MQRKYSINEVMERFNVRMDSGWVKGQLVTEHGISSFARVNVHDLARLGAVIMRLEEKVAGLQLSMARLTRLGRKIK